MFKKIQNLSEGKRRTILWAAMVIIFAGLMFWFVKSAQKRFSSFNSEQFKQNINLPSLNKELNGLPSLNSLDNISTSSQGQSSATSGFATSSQAASSTE